MVQMDVDDLQQVVVDLIEVLDLLQNGCVDAALVVERLHGPNDAYVDSLTEETLEDGRRCQH